MPALNVGDTVQWQWGYVLASPHVRFTGYSSYINSGFRGVVTEVLDKNLCVVQFDEVNYPVRCTSSGLMRVPNGLFDVVKP